MPAPKIKKQTTEEISWVWYLLPILFGIIGGIIGYFLLKDKDEKTAKRLIWVSVIILAAIIVIGILMALFGALVEA